MAGDAVRKRLLISNIYFAPNSFGGATVVTENMARLLKEYHDWDVVIVTSTSDPSLPEYGILRYMAKGVDVIAVNIPHIDAHSDEVWNNEQYNTIFADLLPFVEPDVVHFHSIQKMGVGPVLIAKEAGIPVAVTVHDNWWVCERQFMINHAGHYCHQEVIDLKVCRYCVLDVNNTRRRDSVVRQALNSCDLVLYPSQFHHDFHVANGIAAKRSSVNKNGIVFPDGSFSRTPNPTADKHKLRFGFVGGPGPIKGASIMARAFKKLKRSDYEVKVVNAAVNTGETWALDPVWEDISGTVTMTPPYNQETIDDFFASIDVLLFPSQWKESFGLTVREAIARDVWVVVTDSGGTVEDCIDGENSTIIPMSGNPDELMNAINDLLDNYQPHPLPSDHVTTIAQQAEELNGYLRKLV